MKDKKALDIEKVLDKLPINFRQLSVEDYGEVTKNAMRTTDFPVYNSSQTSCHKFYKPISKLS
jgi:hypothetical protein